LQKDDREAARLYRLAADQGNALAQVSLGVFYETGRGGLPKNDREAARLTSLLQTEEMQLGRPIGGSSMKRVAAACQWTIARPPDFSNSPRTREMCTRELALSA
jgi:hypothetical protein